MPSSSRMNLEIKKKSKSEEGAGCSCWGIHLSSAAASGLAPHPGYGHHRHHDTLGKVTVPMRVTLLDFLKLERSMEVLGDRGEHGAQSLPGLPASVSSRGKALREPLLPPTASPVAHF